MVLSHGWGDIKMTWVPKPLSGVWHWHLSGGARHMWDFDVWAGIGTLGLFSLGPVDPWRGEV